MLPQLSDLVFMSIFTVVAVIALLACAVLRRRRYIDAPATEQPAPTDDAEIQQFLNVVLPPPSDEYSLRCPCCGFSGRMDDLSVIGSTVDCPACEQPFRVLEPEHAGTQC